MELERKSGYYHGYIILEDCVENGEILYDRALKKILENKFACGEGDWWEGIDLFQAKDSQLLKNLKAL